MAKLTLEIEESYDFEVVGICSHAKDYRLSWEINRVLELDLEKDNNYEISLNEEKQSYSFFSFVDEENLAEYYLINNRSSNGMLIPEEKKADYFLVIRGVIRGEQNENLLKKIGNIKNVLTTYKIDVSQLKSRSNLLF